MALLGPCRPHSPRFKPFPIVCSYHATSNETRTRDPTAFEEGEVRTSAGKPRRLTAPSYGIQPWTSVAIRGMRISSTTTSVIFSHDERKSRGSGKGVERLGWTIRAIDTQGAAAAVSTRRKRDRHDNSGHGMTTPVTAPSKVGSGICRKTRRFPIGFDRFWPRDGLCGVEGVGWKL
ncbi:hypothetical protein CRG98_007361 [Punica granatum]|uniref:Uncharacterized protein n=1 Tax=Punica granatum TaxID=22663 RepID=A0A2I0KUZ3_PUNGR|nr:hypothetical protein CRG98_007361 [Punica granatum]